MIFTSLLMATSCQNEEIVSETSEIQSSNYTLNVSSLVKSRTYVEDVEENGITKGQVLWSKGDKLYVYGQGVSGVLTLDDEDAGQTEGDFSGFVFGNPQNLKWAVFGDDVKFTNDGAQFTISEVTDPNSNAPMVGEIRSGSVQMQHLCGMVRLTINDLPENAIVTLGGEGIAGTAEVKDGIITSKSTTNSIILKTIKDSDNVFEVPVFATEEETPVEFTLAINGVTSPFTAPIKVKSLSQDAIKTFNCVVDETTGKVTGFEFAFADTSWDEIISACENKSVPENWNVGDVKTMSIGGQTYKIAIIGKNHDVYTDGGKAPLTFQLAEIYGTTAKMNETQTNTTGWSGSAMRTTTMANILSAMPSEVQNAIKAVNKETLNGTRDGLETTSDKLFLLSEIEVNGSVYFSNNFAEGTRYSYYTDLNSQIMNSGKYPASWWLRGPGKTNDIGFTQINASGYMANGSAEYACGVVFGFCF